MLARLPLTMTLLALVLVGEDVAGSIAVGARLSGVALLASGASALWRGRALDRRELTAGLRRDSALTALTLFGLAAAVAAGAPLVVLYVLAAAQGVAMAALSGGFRALLPAVVPERLVARANAIEAVAIEVAFVAGPPVAGLFSFLGGPVVVLVVMGLFATGAAAMVGGLPPLHPPADRPAFAPWRVRGVLPVLALAFVVGGALGMLESLVPARVVDLGSSAESSAPLLALVAIGSALGGLVASARAERIFDVRLPAAVLLAMFAVLLAPTGAMPTMALLGALLLFVGLPIAPLNALGTLRLHTIVPLGRQAEGFSVFVAAVLLGGGTGQTFVGFALPLSSPPALLAVAAVLPAAAAAGIAVTGGWTALRPRRHAADRR